MSLYSHCNPDQFSYSPTDYSVQDGGDECECGGTLDEHDRCSNCDSGHDDCAPRECFACYERAMGRAEDAYEGER
jgi:hypothetical protein